MISERVSVVPHYVNGFQLKFTSRTSWKAERRFLGRMLDVIPVALTKGRRQGNSIQEVFLEVWFRDAEELDRYVSDRNTFVVALAKAKDDRITVHRDISSHRHWRRLEQNSIETKILEPVRASDVAVDEYTA
jgi:hypothetical protein